VKEAVGKAEIDKYYLPIPRPFTTCKTDSQSHVSKFMWRRLLRVFLCNYPLLETVHMSQA
jgi:hypothetical protein